MTRTVYTFKGKRLLVCNRNVSEAVRNVGMTYVQRFMEVLECERENLRMYNRNSCLV